VRALEPLRLELVRCEGRCDASVRDHRPAPVELDQGHDDAVPAHGRRAEDIDGPPEQVGLDKLARGVGTATTLTRSSSISRAIRLRMVVSVTSSALAISVLLVRPSRCSNRMISRSTSSTGPRPLFI
jgi:hypothetical protein